MSHQKESFYHIDPLRDGISNVQLMDHLGSDLTVVNAARVSMAKEHLEMDVSDTKLLKYLATHQHWTPFSHPQVSFRIKMPIFVARQWFKHQIGITRNEMSRRYVDEEPECYVPKEWRARAPNVKQGSSDVVVPFVDTQWITSRCLAAYRELIADDVCPEMARMVLPQSTYTEFIETGSLAAYGRLCKLRLDPHSQKETRMYAEAVAQFLAALFPVSWGVLV